MFGAFVRAAVGFGAGMLFGTVLSAFLTEVVLPNLAAGLSQQHLLYRSFEGIDTFAPLIVLLAAILGLIAAANTESQLPG